MICWSCQSDLAPDDAVRLDDATWAPCCLACWDELAPVQRIVMGQKLMLAPHAKRALIAVGELIQRHLDAEDQPGWQNWGRG